VCQDCINGRLWSYDGNHVIRELVLCFETVYREHKKLDICMVRCTVSTGYLGSVTMLMNKKIPIEKSITADKQFSTGVYCLKKIYFLTSLAT